MGAKYTVEPITSPCVAKIPVVFIREADIFDMRSLPESVSVLESLPQVTWSMALTVYVPINLSASSLSLSLLHDNNMAAVNSIAA